MCMRYFEQALGKTAVFLLPSLKLRERKENGAAIEEHVHHFLMDNFGGYTAAAGNIFGYWKDQDGSESYGEHREFTIGLADDSKIGVLKAFLARMAAELDEQCIYLVAAGEAVLVYRV
jgi:hypothetical protein